MTDEMKELTPEELDKVNGGVINTPYGNYNSTTELVLSCKTYEEFYPIIKSSNSWMARLLTDEQLRSTYDSMWEQARSTGRVK